MTTLLDTLVTSPNEARLLLLLGMTLCTAAAMIGTALFSLARAGAFRKTPPLHTTTDAVSYPPEGFLTIRVCEE